MKAASNVMRGLADGTVRPAALAGRLIEEPQLLGEVFAGLDAPAARIKFGCAKVLQFACVSNPAALLPYWGRIADLLGSDNKILQWSAMRVLGGLAAVAARRQVQALLPRLLATVPGPVMITAANAIQSATQMALAHPALADGVAQGILEVEKAEYQTAECRNVAIGHAIVALDRLLPLLKDKTPVIAMAQRQLTNRRNAVRQKAALLLKKEARRQESSRLVGHGNKRAVRKTAETRRSP